MGNDLLGVSVTGLRVSQAALRTVGHNIANAGVEGYSRQRVDPATNNALLKSGSYMGTGSHVNSIERVVNNFVTQQIRTDTTLYSDLDGFYSQIRQLDNLLANEHSGLSGGLNRFFSAVHNAADDPTALSARQLVISEADNLAQRFNSIYDRMKLIESGTESAMQTAVSKINALSGNIAQLNQKITQALGAGNGASPNDLLDQRDQALKELSALVPVQVFDQGNGQLNVVMGAGQTLVLGPDARRLSMGTSEQDGSKLDVMFTDGKRSEAVTQAINGGELGGLIRFRDQMMESVYNDLGRVALVMADTFNEQHQKGIDLNNQFGGLFFYDINDQDVARNRVVANSGNTGSSDTQLALYVRDSNQVTTHDYRVEIQNGGLYTITRGDNKEVAKGVLPGQYPFKVEFDGLELAFERGTFRPGDSFKLQPTKEAAKDFATMVRDPSELAFGSPLVSDASLSNKGSGKISSGEVLGLTDRAGNPLPLIGQGGEMSPPLVVRFTGPNSYDVLDNSDPANPVHLDPPIRNQPYAPGTNNPLFTQDPGQTQVSTGGEMIGLPEGRAPVLSAALLPGGSAPDYSLTDFSGANAFAFDVRVSNTSNGARDGVVSVTVDNNPVSDNNALLNSINAQLSGSDAVAYLADDGSLAFRLATPGYGNISLDNYNPDPNGAGNAGAGQANNLLGFDVEGSTYTTVGGEDGISGDGFLSNGYPSERIRITHPTAPGEAPVVSTVQTRPNASARQTASELNNIPGVEANAFTRAVISGAQLSHQSPLQVTLNGTELVEYQPDSVTGLPILAPQVPDPQEDPDAFYDYLAERINANAEFKQQGITALAATNPATGASELRFSANRGDDLRIGLISADGDSLSVSDGENPPTDLAGAGSALHSQVVVGGQMDVRLADGVRLSTTPADSLLFGDTQAADFAQSTYLGVQANISGSPGAGDYFTLDFNRDGVSDNRNALAMAGLKDAKTMAGGTASFAKGYGNLVQKVGTETHSTKINRDASEQVLRQSEALRESISGVNLDEEAADLIRFEQMFSANAQVISVARDIFDRLLAAF